MTVFRDHHEITADYANKYLFIGLSLFCLSFWKLFRIFKMNLSLEKTFCLFLSSSLSFHPLVIPFLFDLLFSWFQFYWTQFSLLSLSWVFFWTTIPFTFVSKTSFPISLFTCMRYLFVSSFLFIHVFICCLFFSSCFLVSITRVFLVFLFVFSVHNLFKTSLWNFCQSKKNLFVCFPLCWALFHIYLFLHVCLFLNFLFFCSRSRMFFLCCSLF